MFIFSPSSSPPLFPLFRKEETEKQIASWLGMGLWPLPFSMKILSGLNLCRSCAQKVYLCV